MNNLSELRSKIKKYPENVSKLQHFWNLRKSANFSALLYANVSTSTDGYLESMQKL